MRFELETKILKVDKAAVLAKIPEAVQVFAGQLDATYYNANGHTLRIRTECDERYNLRKHYLTVKTKADLGLTKVTELPEGFKLLEEYDLVIIKDHDLAAAQRMVEILGFTVFRYCSKRRETYILEDLRIEFDSMEGVPEWMEIEKIVKPEAVICGIKDIQAFIEKVGYTLDDLSSKTTLNIKE